MQTVLPPPLMVRESGGGQVQPLEDNTWRLSIPSGPEGVYRWAQLDDHLSIPRGQFPWSGSLRLSLRARISEPGLLGTWGFGWWNDPFSMSFGLGGVSRRIPALPQAAWFFYASEPNYLSVRDDIPADGFLAATFHSLPVPTPLLAVGAPSIPLLFWPWAARKLRPLARLLVKQDSARLDLDVTAWHRYEIDCQPGRVRFSVDGQEAFATRIAPTGKLGLILWIDNQFMAYTSQGRLRFGTLPNPNGGWLELAEIGVSGRAAA